MLTTREKEIFDSLIEDCEKKAQLSAAIIEKLAPFDKVVSLSYNKPDYLPIIFAALSREWRWSLALRKILNDGPEIAPEDSNNPSVVVAAWLDFGTQKGII